MVAPRTPPTGDLACNPGMFPDWESNWRPFGSQPALSPLIYTSQGYLVFLYRKCGVRDGHFFPLFLFLLSIFFKFIHFRIVWTCQHLFIIGFSWSWKICHCCGHSCNQLLSRACYTLQMPSTQTLRPDTESGFSSFMSSAHARNIC